MNNQDPRRTMKCFSRSFCVSARLFADYSASLVVNLAFVLETLCSLLLLRGRRLSSCVSSVAGCAFMIRPLCSSGRSPRLVAPRVAPSDITPEVDMAF